MPPRRPTPEPPELPRRDESIAPLVQISAEASKILEDLPKIDSEAAALDFESALTICAFEDASYPGHASADATVLCYLCKDQEGLLGETFLHACEQRDVLIMLWRTVYTAVYNPIRLAPKTPVKPGGLMIDHGRGWQYRDMVIQHWLNLLYSSQNPQGFLKPGQWAKIRIPTLPMRYVEETLRFKGHWEYYDTSGYPLATM